MSRFCFLAFYSFVRYNTDELARHYIRDFGAVQIFAKRSGGPALLMIADNAALSLFNTYLS